MNLDDRDFQIENMDIYASGGGEIRDIFLGAFHSIAVSLAHWPIIYECDCQRDSWLCAEGAESAKANERNTEESLMRCRTLDIHSINLRMFSSSKRNVNIIRIRNDCQGPIGLSSFFNKLIDWR